MKDNSFVKIENKKMPIDNFKDLDFEISNKSPNGFTSFLFLSGIVVTAIMWIMLVIIGK